LRELTLCLICYFILFCSLNVGLTAVGDAMSRLPLDPPLAKALLTANSYGCLEEMLVIVAILSTKHMNLFIKKSKEARRIHEFKETYASKSGDLLAYLKLWQEWKAAGFNKDWNRQFLNISVLLEARDIQQQLEIILVE